MELAACGTTVEVPVDSDAGAIHGTIPNAGVAVQSGQVGDPASTETLAREQFGESLST
ncbi:MAG TPA: hypothetical protein VHZ74_09160 [Bryobacteraceae bacterium]|nr:hypothetical protein [Bryobacteraceae bacterium]